MVGDIFNIYQTRFRLYKELYYHKTVKIIENMLLDILIYADKFRVFAFKDSRYIPLTLAESIDDVESFLLTNDDIIGQLERCPYPEIVSALNRIKKREFIEIENDEERIAHYGMKDKNPLMLVKFINKDFTEHIFDKNDVIESMCPQKFFIAM